MRTRTAGALLACALVVAACGDDDGDDAADVTTTEAPATTAAPDTTTTVPDDGATDTLVEVVDSPLGEILASDGRTLYVFLPDDGSGASTCYEGCAATWPPLLAEGDPTLGDGVDPALVATTTRDDGGEQVTIDGWPLYFYASDAAPGDTNGQGVNDVWWVVAPDGTAVQG